MIMQVYRLGEWSTTLRKIANQAGSTNSSQLHEIANYLDSLKEYSEEHNQFISYLAKALTATDQMKDMAQDIADKQIEKERGHDRRY